MKLNITEIYSVGRGLTDLADHDQQRSSRFPPTVKTKAPMQLYASDDGRGDARNMLSHT
jgi:hypothetical protein